MTAAAQKQQRPSCRFPGALEPQQWCDTWEIPRLEACPLTGDPPDEDRAGLSHQARLWPGRNRTGLGVWIATRYAAYGTAVLDPFFGVGQMWQGNHGILVPWEGQLDRFDCEATPVLRTAEPRSAIRPREHPHRFGAVITSPPYQGNHSSGATESQLRQVQAYGHSSCQAFAGDHPDNLGRMSGPDYWAGIAQAYRMVVECDLHEQGFLAVVVRNRVKCDREVDEVGRHVALMAAAGLELVGAHPRDLVCPKLWQGRKIAKGLQTAWVRWEWIVVGRRRR